MIILSSIIIIKGKEKKKKLIQHLFTYHNVNIRLFSRYDVENA